MNTISLTDLEVCDKLVLSLLRKKLLLQIEIRKSRNMLLVST